MTIGDLIKNKDYDYVSYRLTLPDGDDTFAGCFASKNGEIIPLDGDIYDKDEEVLRYEEWSQPEDDIQNGLTVVVKGEWISGRNSRFIEGGYMKLKECLEIGKTCGLTTLEECYDNVYLHAGSLFKYDEIGKEILELQQDMFACDPDKFCQIFKATKEELIAKGWIVDKKQSYKEREEELKVEYENFIKTKEGQEWKEHWIKRYKDPDDIRDAGDFGDYLYDFHTEMLM